MKKFTFVLLSLALVLSLAGCKPFGRRTTTTETPTTVTQQAPTINGAVDVELELNERYIPMKGISAVDANGKDITDDVVYTGDVDYTKVGVYHATFTVTDSNGLTTSVTITVKVVSSDKDAPVLSGVADIEIPVTSEFDPMQGVSAIDTVDGDLTDKVQVEGTIDTKNLGTHTLKYTVTDAAGNKAERSRVVRVTEGRFVFEEVSEENKVTCDPADLNGVYTFVLIKVKYSVAAAGDVTVALGDYSVTHHHDAAGEFEAYVRADEALTDQAVTLTGATFVQLMVAGCPDITAPVITGEFNQIFMVSKDHKDLAAQFVSEMAEAVARDDTDGFITKDCYMEYPEGFDWDSTEEQTAYFCAKDQAGNEAKKEVKVVVAAETKLADMLPYADSADTEASGDHADGSPMILMYRNMVLTKQEDNTIKLSGMVSGWYNSFNMIKYDLSNLSYGNTYMLKLTAKFLPGESGQATQQIGYRIGQSLGGDPWYVEFSGFSYDYFYLTPELTTTYHIFKYDVEKDATSAGEAMEFQFGNILGGPIYDVVLVSFELYLISNENQAPVLNRNNALPTIFVKGEEAPDLTKYFTSYDVEDGAPEIVITGAVDMSKKGTYPVTFTATDSEGKTTSVTLNFEVLNEADTIAPEIKWESPNPEHIPVLPEELKVDEYSTDAVKNFFMQGLKITDQKDGATIQMAAKDASINWGGFDASKPGKYTIRVTATDDSGNSTTESFVIKVVKEQQGGQSELTLVTELKPTESACENLSFEENDGIVKLTPTSVENAWASFNKIKYTITSNLEVGKSYRFVLEAKADIARDIAISVGGNYWPNNENLAKLICDLGTEFKTFALDFEYTGQTPTGVAVSVVELEFQAGKDSAFTGEQSTTNSVYVKSFALYEVVTAKEPEPKKADLKIDFEDGAGSGTYVNSKWAQEKYQNDAWVSMSQQMNSRIKNNTKIANVVGTTILTRYTYTDGDSLGLANYLSIEMGNYFDPKQPISMKLVLIDKNDDEIYLLGSADGENEWHSVPVGDALVKSEFKFDEAEITAIRIILKEGSGNFYLYLDNINLMFGEEKPEIPEQPETDVVLLLDFEDGTVGSLYSSSKWTQEKYNWNSETSTGSWGAMSAGQMYSKQKDDRKVVNVKGFKGLTTRYTYSDGESLGNANYFSCMVGNYYSGVVIDFKVVLIDKAGNSIYLMGGQNEWAQLPVTQGLFKYETVFNRAEIAAVRIVLGNVTKDDGVFIYLDDIQLRDIEMVKSHEATIANQTVELSQFGEESFVQLSCAALGLKQNLSYALDGTTYVVTLKDVAKDGAYLTLTGQAAADQSITITAAEGSFAQKDLFVNAKFEAVAAAE